MSEAAAREPLALDKPNWRGKVRFRIVGSRSSSETAKRPSDIHRPSQIYFLARNSLFYRREISTKRPRQIGWFDAVVSHGVRRMFYLPEEDAYRRPAGERLPYRYTNEDADKMLRRYWTNACKNCLIKSQCTPGSERRITRWEHEHLLDAVQQRLDANPLAMRQRRETVEDPFGTMKARMGATHFLTKILPRVAAEMALLVLAYNLTRVINIIGVEPLMAAIAT